MKLKRISQLLTALYFALAIFVVILLAQSLILTWLSQFKLPYVLIGSFFSLLIFGLSFRLVIKNISLLPLLSLPVFIIVFLLVLVLVFFPHDTFGGRDEGFYSGVAVYLANNGTLNVPLYLEKSSINVVESTKIFPPAYVAWLALQKIIFGRQWLLRSNSILISLGLCSLFLVSSLMSNKITGIIGALLLSSSMPFLWFARETMSENLSFFLLWTSILFLITSFRSGSIFFLIISFLTIWLAALTRFEQFFSQFLLVLASFTLWLTVGKRIPLKKVLSVCCVFFLLFFITLTKINNFSYQQYLKNVWPAIEMIKTNITSPLSSLPTTTLEKSTKISSNSRLSSKALAFFPLMLAKYNLALVIFSIFLSVGLILLNKKIGPSKKIYLACALIIIAPEFFKFINPKVTLEQPWMYRRYFYALLPLGYISLAIILQKFSRRKLQILLVGLLLILNLLLSSNTLTLKNNWQITEKIEKLTESISPDDFVIIKDLKLLSTYYPISFLSYQRAILGEFSSRINPDDLDPKERKFKGISYDKLFLLSDKENERFQNFELKKISSAWIKSKQLVPNCDLVPLRAKYQILDSYSLPYSEVMPLCQNIENEITTLDKQVFLYELIRPNSQP